MQIADTRKLTPLLNELCAAVEELLLAGLTAASKSTVERIDVSFKEASRMKLLRQRPRNAPPLPSRRR